MSATVLYHMLGIRGYKLVKQKVVSGGIEFYIECQNLACPCCGSANVWRKGGKIRKFRSVPIGSKKTTVILDVPRIHCQDCQAKQQVHLTFSGDPEMLEGGYYVLDLHGNGATVLRWEIDWGDGSTLQTVVGTATSVSHFYGDGDEEFDITVTAVTQHGNLPPTVITTPPSTHLVPSDRGDATPGFGPDRIELELGNGESETETVTVSIGLEIPKIDVFLLFDDTGSFAGDRHLRVRPGTFRPERRADLDDCRGGRHRSRRNVRAESGQ